MIIPTVFSKKALTFIAFLWTCRSVEIGPCDCHEGWAKCNSGWGEDGSRGCANSGKSCAQLCPGDFEWKVLYQKTVDAEAALEKECEADPSAKWGVMDAGTEGPFAVAFANGLRNFVANWPSWKKNLVEPSGGNVHLYFHGDLVFEIVLLF